MALVTDDIVFESTSPAPDGTRYEGRDAVRQIWAEVLAATPRARFSVEEQFSDGSGRAVVRWRYDWADGHVRGVDIVRVRNGQLAESLAYVKGERTTPHPAPGRPRLAPHAQPTAVMVLVTSRHVLGATEQSFWRGICGGAGRQVAAPNGGGFLCPACA